MKTDTPYEIPDLGPAPRYSHHWTLQSASGDLIAAGTDDGDQDECDELDIVAMDRFIVGLVTVQPEEPPDQIDGRDAHPTIRRE